MDLVANSTPMVDLDSRLNSFLVKRESTGGRKVAVVRLNVMHPPVEITYNCYNDMVSDALQSIKQAETHDFPTPESPISTT